MQMGELIGLLLDDELGLPVSPHAIV